VISGTTLVEFGYEHNVLDRYIKNRRLFLKALCKKEKAMSHLTFRKASRNHRKVCEAVLDSAKDLKVGRILVVDMVSL